MTSTGTGSSASCEGAGSSVPIGRRPALIFAAIDLPEAYWPEFHDWYEDEHIPQRRDVGLEPITRWERHSGELPRFLALTEARTLDLLETGPYAQLKAAGDTPWTARLKKVFTGFERGLYVAAAAFGGDSPGRYCAVAVTVVPGAFADAYAEWYDTAHGPAVAEVPGVRRLRRFFSVDDASHHLTIVDVESPDVLTSAAYEAAKAAHPADELRAAWRRRQALYVRWHRPETPAATT